MEFSNDIFISYAHIDNQPLVKDTDGWVSQFHHALEVRVDQLLGHKSSIWRDLKLEGNDYFGDKIVDQLPGVAVLVSVLSPRYVHSDWCIRELDTFCQVSDQTGGLRVGEKTRIFKILKTPVPMDEHPANIRAVLGYEFFTIDPDTGRARELNKVFGGEAERAFWFKLDDLAQDMCHLLHQLEDDTAQPCLAADTSPTFTAEVLPDAVFIASCSFDLKEQQEAIRRDLTGLGVRVFPEGPLPDNTAERSRLVAEILGLCAMSIHPLGRHYGSLLEGADHSAAAQDNQLAQAREEQGGFSRLVWIPPGLQAEDQLQYDLISAQRSNPRLEYGADLLEGPLEDLKTQIHELLKANKQASAKRAAEPKPISAPLLPVRSAPVQLTPVPAAPVQPVQASSPLSPSTQAQAQAEADQYAGDDLQCIYLICDATDMDSINELADCLFDAGFEVILPVFEGDEAEVREDHEDSLCRADAVLIYYARGNDLWLKRKLRELRKSDGQRRSVPLKAKSILVAPPHSRDKQWLRTREALVIQQPDAFSRELLDPFLAQLRR